MVCQDVAAFTSSYPRVTNYLNRPFEGRLDNGGERITLSRLDESNRWVTVDTIKYRDGGPADGDGPSLELVHPGFARLRDQCYGAWAPSTSTNGTPGARNSVYDPDPPPVVEYVLHDPPIPPGDSVVRIRARATARDSDVLSVQLLYRKDAIPTNSWNVVTMHDDALDGDEVAGDGVYSAYVPPFGKPLMQAGDMLKFRIVVSDGSLSRIYPAESTAGVEGSNLSYLCQFLEDDYRDCAYPREYPTYYLLMTQTNRAVLEKRNRYSNDLLDSTVITSAGEIFYNSGVRYRGGSTRGGNEASPPYISYHVEFPRGQKLDGFQDIGFNHSWAQTTFIGMTLMARAGYDCYAPDVQLCRLWLNTNNLAVQNS